jgi:hypothetical protein
MSAFAAGKLPKILRQDGASAKYQTIPTYAAGTSYPATRGCAPVELI